MKVKIDVGAWVPTRAHETDAGLDLKAMEGQIVPAKESATFRTGVHIQLPRGTAGILLPRSGLKFNHGIISLSGVIDEGYTGEIKVMLHNLSGYDYEVKAGDKISQLVIVPVRYEPIEIVDSLEETTERGNSGFGSTGR